MNSRILWSRILKVVGGIAMALGTIDPLESSVLILPDSGLVALGTYLEPMIAGPCSTGPGCFS